MTIVIALWPDSTISILGMPRDFTAVDLFAALDAEADPLLAECYVVRRDKKCGHFHIATSGEPGEFRAPARLVAWAEEGRLKPYPWPDDVAGDYVRSVGRRH